MADERNAALAAIQVEGLSYAYPDGTPVLRDMSFSVAAGQTIVLAGMSGCGKTTLCHCLSGLAPKALGGTLQGVVRLAGEDIASLPLPRLACRIGFVFQDPDNQMVTTAVEDEVAFALENLGADPPRIRARVDHELQRFGLTSLALRRPNRLSGGEKRLVALASVLVLDPPIVIFDEPFTHLDEHGRRLVREAILDLQKEGRTVVVVEHDLSQTDFAQRYLLIVEGRLVSDTTFPPAELMDDDHDRDGTGPSTGAATRTVAVAGTQRPTADGGPPRAEGRT